MRFLWLDGIFDENTVKSFKAISPASNFWQVGLANALKGQGNTVDAIGHPFERVWPFGRLLIRAKQACLAHGLDGAVVGYINVPLFRGLVQYIQYLRAVKRHLLILKNLPDYLLTYSCLSRKSDITPSIRIAKAIRTKFNIPWICVVADGVAPDGADGYVYLTWSSYKVHSLDVPSIHIDGGVPEIQVSRNQNHCCQAKVLMYMGALTSHGGADILARAFHCLPDQDIRLWICGKGSNDELSRLAAIDTRISLMGFVGEEKLHEYALQATAFANPRPTNFMPNKLNYPSKLLHYLAYGKPVISTITEGLSPDYTNVLIPISKETEICLAEVIRNVLNMSQTDYNFWCNRILQFNNKHTWSCQIERFLSWLKNDVRNCI